MLNDDFQYTRLRHSNHLMLVLKYYIAFKEDMKIQMEPNSYQLSYSSFSFVLIEWLVLFVMIYTLLFSFNIYYFFK